MPKFIARARMCEELVLAIEAVDEDTAWRIAEEIDGAAWCENRRHRGEFRVYAVRPTQRSLRRCVTLDDV